MKIKQCLATLLASAFLVCSCSPNAKTFNRLNHYIETVEKDVKEDERLKKYRKVYYGATIHDELVVGLKLFRHKKDKNKYSVIIAYRDANFTFDRGEDNLYFTQNHWVGGTIKEVIGHFNDNDFEVVNNIEKKAIYSEFQSIDNLKFYIGVPFIENGKKGILIYGVIEMNKDGIQNFAGYGNGENLHGL